MNYDWYWLTNLFEKDWHMNQYEIVVVAMVEYEIQFPERDYFLILSNSSSSSSLDKLLEPSVVVDLMDRSMQQYFHRHIMECLALEFVQ